MDSQSVPMIPDPAPLEHRPAADVRAAPSDTDAVGEQNSALHWPVEDLNDFPVRVRASVLTRCRARLTAVSQAGFPYGELTLGVACLACGSTLSALISGVALDTLKGGVFYVGLPVIGVGFAVAYAMHRRSGIGDLHQAAKESLDDLPDPERTVPTRGDK